VTYCSNPVLTAVPNVIINLTGTSSGSTTTDNSGFYSFGGLSFGANYAVTPIKAAFPMGTSGITTFDVIAVQKHFLNIALLPGGRLTAADVNGDSGVNTADVIAISKFFLQIQAIANVGKYQFNPTSRSYSPFSSEQTGQNYDAVVIGDVTAPYVQ